MNILNRINLFSPIKRLMSSINKDESLKSSVQVAVLGCSSPLGRFITMMLKQNPVVSNMHLFGENSHLLAFDLNFMDTRCKALSYDYENSMIGKAIRCADIVVMIGEGPKHPYLTLSDLVMLEGHRAVEYAKACTIYAPKAVVVVAIPPVSVYTPIVDAIFKKTAWYHPGRIIGSASYAEIKANILVAKYTQMDPQLVNVPVIGGPDIDTAVPLFSRAVPAGIPTGQCPELAAHFRGVRAAHFPKSMTKENYFEISAIGEAVGLNRLITRIALGICGDTHSCSPAFVRTNVLPTCQHLVTTVQFAESGVVHNFGIPELNKLEMRMLTKAMLDIKEREQMAQEYIDYADSDGDCEPAFAMRQHMLDEAKEKKIVKALFLD